MLTACKDVAILSAITARFSSELLPLISSGRSCRACSSSHNRSVASNEECDATTLQRRQSGNTNFSEKKSWRIQSKFHAVNDTLYLSSCGLLSSPAFSMILPKATYARGVSYLSDPTNSGEQTRGVNFDTLGSWNNKILQKIDFEESVRRGTIVPEIDLGAVGINSLIGRREVNEDRYICTQIKPNVLFLGVFDGHGGTAAVDHVTEFLPKHIAHWLDKGEENLGDILRKSFVEVNNSFTQQHIQKISGSTKSPVSSGTTATVCVIRNGVELTVGHVGDSRAILCRNNNAIKLTVDHLPSEHAEAARIVKCQGHLTWSSLGRSRVNGRLEMTRSIGDIELKKFGVIADPDIINVKIRNGSDSFLVLTTDGIHSRLNSSEIVQLIASCTTPAEAAEFLNDQAMMFGSEDNCTSVVIPFGSWGKYSSTPRPVYYGRGRNPGMGWGSSH